MGVGGVSVPSILRSNEEESATIVAHHRKTVTHIQRNYVLHWGSHVATSVLASGVQGSVGKHVALYRYILASLWCY